MGNKRSTGDCAIYAFELSESYLKRVVDLLIYYQFKLDKLGDSGRTRTPNLLIRSQLLYPVELRNRCRAVVPDLTGLVQYRPSAPAHIDKKYSAVTPLVACW